VNGGPADLPRGGGEYPDGTVAGVQDWHRQAEKVYENIGHVLRAAGATPAHGGEKRPPGCSTLRPGASTALRYVVPSIQGDYPASTLVEIPG